MVEPERMDMTHGQRTAPDTGTGGGAPGGNRWWLVAAALLLQFSMARGYP